MSGMSGFFRCTDGLEDVKSVDHLETIWCRKTATSSSRCILYALPHEGVEVSDHHAKHRKGEPVLHGDIPDG